MPLNYGYPKWKGFIGQLYRDLGQLLKCPPFIAFTKIDGTGGKHAV